MDRIIGIGEYDISNDKTDKIMTFALASCVAVTAYCSSKSAAGMVHIALPSHALLNDESKMQPGYYATTAVPLLINKMYSKFGCLRGELEINLFGGADSVREDDVFNIGRRNIAAVKSILNEMYLRYNYAQTGGIHCRTLEMEVATGRIKVAKQVIMI